MARNVIHCPFYSCFLSVTDESIDVSYFITLYFARGAHLWNHNFAGPRARCSENTANGANVLHQHPRLTCAGMSEFLTTSDARFILIHVRAPERLYISMMFRKTLILLIDLYCKFLFHIIFCARNKCIKWFRINLSNKSRSQNEQTQKRRAIYK